MHIPHDPLQLSVKKKIYIKNYNTKYNNNDNYMNTKYNVFFVVPSIL